VSNTIGSPFFVSLYLRINAMLVEQRMVKNRKCINGI